MAIINFSNPGNLPSLIELGADTSSTEGTSVGAFLSGVLDLGHDAYNEFRNALTSLPLNNDANKWVVTSVETVPAGSSSLSRVQFENNDGLKLSLAGTLTNTGTSFSLSGTSISLESTKQSNEYALDLKSTAAWTLAFNQNDSAKTYDNQLNFYNGNTTAAAVTAGALPLGARLTSIGTPPLVFSQVGVSDDDRESYISLQGTFTITPASTANPFSKLTGTLLGVKDFYIPESGLGMAVQTLSVANGSFDSSIPDNDSFGKFKVSASSAPTISTVMHQQSDTVGVMNLATLQFDLSPASTATTTYAQPKAISLSTDIGLGDKESFVGNDTFTVTSTTDVAIFAGKGNDSVTSGSGNDFIYGGQGDDTLNGGAGHDLFIVNQGGSNPSVNTVTSTTLSSVNRLGRDLIDGGAGIDTLSFDTGNDAVTSRPANLQLILPASWYGATSTRGTGNNYVTTDGLLGKKVGDFYGEIVAPAADSVGFIFTNSATSQSPGANNEYVVVKNVEYLEIASPSLSGFTTYDTYDIRPLYLASTGADTLYTLTRQNFDDLVRVLDASGVKEAVGSASDPLSWYRNQFAIESYNGIPDEWRYYLNSGAGNDTLHGTQDTSGQTQVSRINLELDNLPNQTTVIIKVMTTGNQPTQKDSISVTFTGNWSTFNNDLVAQLNALNLGISAQRGNSNEQVIVTGLGEAGLSLTSESTAVYPTSPTAVKIANMEVLSVGERGRDVLDGGAGADVMIGYSGSDSYYVDNAADQVIESGWHTGFDTVLTNTSFALTADAAVERLMVHQIIPSESGRLFAEPRATEPALASPLAINLTGSNYTYEYLGHDGANTITAGQFSGFSPLSGPKEGALLIGMGGNDRLVGGELDDHFFGGSGNDTLLGGAGSDSFYMGFGLADVDSSQLLPEQYNLLRQLGAEDNPSFLTGGDDVVSGGAGYDVVVVGLGTDGEQGYDTQLSFQRISETQIKISTALDSIVVDNSVEAVRYLTSSQSGPAIAEALLPWVVSGDERSRDVYYNGGYKTGLNSVLSAGQATGPQGMAYTPSSAFSDFIDLTYYPYADQYETESGFDAGAGNDVVYGGSVGISQIRGGAGDDWVYGGGYAAENDAWEYSLYGEAGNDTLTLYPADISGMAAPKVLLDGGDGNDHYRVSLTGLSTSSPDTRIRIEDSTGTADKLTLTMADDGLASQSPSMQLMWEANELRVLRLQDDDPSDRLLNTQVYLSAKLGTIEQLFVTRDDEYFSNALWGGNLINPNATSFSTGRLTGTAAADVLLPMIGVALSYDGGAGDDLIVLGAVTGSVVTGGAGNNLILVDENYGRNPLNTLSYAWSPSGANAEIDLKTGYSFVVNSAGTLLGTDRFETGPFVNVLGGAANETIKGNESVNRLEGGAGDDVLFSGQNTPMPLAAAHEWRSLLDQALPERDVLIGGAGNDILVEEGHWGSLGEWNNSQYPNYTNGSLLDGGAGNDIYVLQHNGMPPGWVTPTKIVERNPNGTDSGGLDTIRFVTSGSGVSLYSFAQTGNTVRVSTSAFDDIAVGDSFLAAFSSGPTSSNIYTVSALIKDSSSNVTGFEFLAPNAVNQSGSLGIVMDPTIDGMGVWADANNFALFSSGDVNEAALDKVQDGRNMIEDFDGNSLITDLSVQALIDRNAMDFMEFGSTDPLVAGVRLPVSFNVGKSAGLEIVMAGANGDAVLYGGAGTDMIMDSAWNDILIGGDAHDVLSSHFGKDILLGGAGNDSLRYRADGQVLVGGTGADSFVMRGLGNAPATVADFKPWEGDKLVFDEDWLFEFVSGEHRTDGLLYSNLSVSFDPWTNSDDHISFKLSYDWKINGERHTTSVEFLNVAISADHDRAYDQLDASFLQLKASLDAVA